MSAFMHFIKRNFSPVRIYQQELRTLPPDGTTKEPVLWFLSVFGQNSVILSTAKPGPPNTRSIYSIDYQYRWNLSINRFLFCFGNAWGWMDPLPAPKYPLMCNKLFDLFTKKLYFTKRGEWLEGENSGTSGNFSYILKQPSWHLPLWWEKMRFFYSEEKGERIVEILIIKITKENIKHSQPFFFFFFKCLPLFQ